MIQRISRNGVLNLTLALMLISPVAVAAPPSEDASAFTQKIRERIGQESGQIITTAGNVTISAVNSKDGMPMKIIALSGKKIYSLDDFYLEIERVFDYPDKSTVLLIAASSGGIACPAQYRFLSIRADGSTSLTDKFGTCSDVPTIMLSNDKITVTLPDMLGRGNEVWMYLNEGLSKVQSINPDIERNAPRLVFKENEPTRVHGTLIRSQSMPQDWLLQLPKLTLLDGGDVFRSCHQLTDSLSIDNRITIPKASKGDFTITIACPDSGAIITKIQPSNISVTTTSSTHSTLIGEWACKVRKNNNAPFYTSYKFERNGNFSSIGHNSQMAGTYQSSGNNITAEAKKVTLGGITLSSNMKIDINLISAETGYIKFDTRIVKTGSIYHNDCTAKATTRNTPIHETNLCNINPAACAVIQRNNDIRSQIQSQRCAVLRGALSGVLGGDYQLEKAGCQ